MDDVDPIGVVVVAVAAVLSPPVYLFIKARSEKLWLLFAKAAALEFMTAAATESDGSSPDDAVLIGEENPDCRFCRTWGDFIARPCNWDSEVESREAKISSRLAWAVEP